MNNYTNVLIHNKRLEKGWSQESLSHGICSVSYLSKLEKGTIQPQSDITDKLLEKLNIHLETDLKDILPKVKTFYHSFILFTIDESHFLSDAEITRLLNSKYCLDGLLIQAWQNVNQSHYIEQLKGYESFFSYEQKKKYYQILVYTHQFDYHKLLTIFPDLDTYSIIADTFHRQGKYAQSIPYYIQYYDAASTKCDLENMIYAKMSLGSVYACLFDMDACIEYYQQALSLISKTNIQFHLEQYIYYNIGATYTELENYDLALKYLNKIKTPFEDVLYYHKLAICYEKKGNVTKALSMVKKGLCIDCPFQFLLQVVNYRLTHLNYMQDVNYEKLLLDTIQTIEQNFPISFVYMQENELLKYYEKNRRYKDAYLLLKKRQSL